MPVYNAAQDVLGGLIQGASLGQMLQQQTIQKQQMERQRQQDEDRKRMQAGQFDMHALEMGLRPITPEDELALQTGIRSLPNMTLPNAQGPTINGVAPPARPELVITNRNDKSDLREVKNPVTGTRYAYSQSEILANKTKQAQAMEEARQGPILNRLKQELQMRGDARKSELNESGVDILDPNTGRMVRVPAGYADDAARGFSSIFQAQHPKAPALHFVNTTDDEGNVTVAGVDASGKIVSQQTLPGAGKRTKPGKAGGGGAESSIMRMSPEDRETRTEAARRETAARGRQGVIDGLLAKKTAAESNMVKFGQAMKDADARGDAKAKERATAEYLKAKQAASDHSARIQQEMDAKDSLYREASSIRGGPQNEFSIIRRMAGAK